MTNACLKSELDENKEERVNEKKKKNQSWLLYRDVPFLIKCDVEILKLHISGRH